MLFKGFFLKGSVINLIREACLYLIIFSHCSMINQGVSLDLFTRLWGSQSDITLARLDSARQCSTPAPQLHALGNSDWSLREIQNRDLTPRSKQSAIIKTFLPACLLSLHGQNYYLCPTDTSHCPPYYFIHRAYYFEAIIHHIHNTRRFLFFFPTRQL